MPIPEVLVVKGLKKAEPTEGKSTVAWLFFALSRSFDVQVSRCFIDAGLRERLVIVYC